MKKMAIFVEGLTELKFIDRLLREIITERHLQIAHARASGGARGSRRVMSISAISEADGRSRVCLNHWSARCST
jgi:hypothetical protein